MGVPLKYTATNHLEVKARINGIEGRFILDTGASNTCIAMDRAEYFELVSEVSEVKAAGAGALEMDTQLSVKNEISLGNWVCKRHKIVLLDLVHVNQALTIHNARPVDGILGADILRKAKAVIDYHKGFVYLKAKK